LSAAADGGAGAGGQDGNGGGDGRGEEGGVIIEAESVAPQAPWAIQTEKAGFPGAGYVTWTAGTSKGPPPGA
jgi:hypothetical protein